MSTFIHSQTPRQLHAALASALTQPNAVRSELIHDFHAAMLATDGLLSSEGVTTQANFLQAISIQPKHG